MGANTGARSGALTIGQLSRLTGVNIENIRYFEKVGLLSAPPRTEGASVLQHRAHAHPGLHPARARTRLHPR